MRLGRMKMSTRQDKWFVATSPRPDAEVRLLAFTAAGGGCASFARQAEALPDWLEMLTLNLPGRQARFVEPPCTDLAELAGTLAGDCAGLTAPYLMFGYCSGALIAYLVACGLAERGALLPERLVVVSYPAPDLTATPPVGDLSSDKLWRLLIAHQAVPPALAGQPEVRELAEPVLRADIELIAGYRHRQAPPLPVPITVIAGERDPAMASGAADGWQRCCVPPLRRVWLPAGHWLLEEEPALTVSALVAEAERVKGRTGAGVLPNPGEGNAV